MATPALAPLEKLQTYNHSQLLDVVDQLRALGLSNLLPLPQLIVCGDQSSGKSSVLEAISGVPFPKKDNLCTRFATEVILRRGSDNEATLATLTIRPGQDRSETDRLNLRKFDRILPDVQELPDAVQQAKEAMGLGSIGSNAFFTDVLRLEITGPRMPQLTIVDLPGLIHSENRYQSSKDVGLVAELVRGYMAQPRSVILAVVSAKNDYANQAVLQMAKEVDPERQRTLGIITKPDTLHVGSEGERSFLNLARNADAPLKLGWQVVRNLDTNATLADSESRDSLETHFFQTSNWKALPKALLGVASLRHRLSEVLFGQITQELPHLMEEIETCKNEYQHQLERLGRSRETEQEQRLYLTELNQKIYDICRSACDGNYDDGFFRAKDGLEQPFGGRRLRAVLQNQGIEFARHLERNGARWQISERTNLERGQLTRGAAVTRVVMLLKRSRGRELPGTYNPMLISELFQEYSSSWDEFSKQHVYDVWQHATRFLDAVLRNFADESVAEMYARLVIGPEMDQILIRANEALAAVFEEQQHHAMTYNHYFAANVIQFRNERRKRHMTKVFEKIIATRAKQFDVGEREFDADDIPWLVDQLIEHEEPDADRLTAEEVLDKMRAYYKVAVKRIIDNIPNLVIESIIVKRMLGLIQPIKAATMDKALVQDIAGESPEKREHRLQVTQKVEILENSERLCKRYSAQSTKTPSASVDSDDGEWNSVREDVLDDDSSSESQDGSVQDGASDVTERERPVSVETL